VATRAAGTTVTSTAIAATMTAALTALTALTALAEPTTPTLLPRMHKPRSLPAPADELPPTICWRV
jgi:hypothetical protein